MKYIILATNNSRTAGGLCAAIAGVTREVNKKSRLIDLVSCNDLYTKEDWGQYGYTINHSYNVCSLPLLSSFGYSFDLSNVLEKRHPQIIDVQGLWMYHSFAALRYQKRHPEIKKVITPHGMLDPWAVKNSAWKKKLVGHLFEYKNLRTADCFHALCYSEYESIRKFGLKQPVAVIPNGIDLPTNPRFIKNNEKKVLLYISRIHPKKGLKDMIEGVALIRQQSPEILQNWTIRIAGWNQLNHQEELETLSANLGVNDIVSFIGPVFGEVKEKELCQADAFILPSFSEGLPMSILEAWAYKLPCIMTEFCNIPEGFDADAAIKIEPNANSIAKGLKYFFELSEDQQTQIGENGYKLCRERFTWSTIAKMKIEMYEWLLGERDKPNFIYLD